jgi:hypothetical protein
MKILKFNASLVPTILDGSKTATWRLFDDKDLQAGEYIELRVFGSEESFARARIVTVKELLFKDLTENDRLGHEAYQSNEQMYAEFSRYYNTTVGPMTSLKIVNYQVINKIPLQR